MRDKQPPATNLPSIEETNQSRTVKMPTKSQVDPKPDANLTSLDGPSHSRSGHSGHKEG
jgi:hypothetical protein